MPEKEPDLYEQTMRLGSSLRAVSERDPNGTPSPIAATAFTNWLKAVGTSNLEQRYFDDVAENYDISRNSNKDLFTIFEMLHQYVDYPAPEEPATPKAFIALPVV